jgi:hypothetical protein
VTEILGKRKKQVKYELNKINRRNQLDGLHEAAVPPVRSYRSRANIILHDVKQL